MASLKERVTTKLADLREQHGWIDHTIRMVQHYGSVNGNAQSGAVTFFGFLAVFPILALAFFVVGKVAGIYPGIRPQMAQEINNLLPGVVGTGDGQVRIRDIEDYAATVGLFGLVGVIYSGLGWLSGMRQALGVMFVTPRGEQPNFVLGKLRDLGTLLLIGLILLTSVAISGAVTGFSSAILRLIGIDPESLVPNIVLAVLGHALAIVASTVLLLAMFKLLITHSYLPRRSMQEGALLGAIGFEGLKLVANLLLGGTAGSPAFQAFGVALILVVWINYFSRLVMYAASWAYTSPRAQALREAEAMIAPGAALASASTSSTGTPDQRQPPPVTDPPGVASPRVAAPDTASTWRALLGVGIVTAVAAGLVRRIRGA